MASDDKFVAFIRDQMAGAGPISTRKMFGEFAIYRGETVVAFVCDNQLFVKPTVAGKSLLGEPSLAPPYPGAKPHFLIEDMDDGEFLSALIAATARELPVPKAKPAKKSAPGKETVKPRTVAKETVKAGSKKAAKKRATKKKAAKKKATKKR